MRRVPLPRWARQELVKRHGLVSRLLPDRHLPYWTHGGRIYLNVKESPMMLARVLGLYEEAKHEAFAAFTRPGATVVDVGANKGDFTLLSAELAGGGGRIFSFEPEPKNCEWLRKSVRASGHGNVRVIEVALSDADGEAVLHLGAKSGWHTLLPGGASRSRGSVVIRTRTLDGVLAEAGVRAAHVVKVDVEGAELAVLRGARKTLLSGERVAVLLDLHPALGADPRETCAFLEGLGFRLYEMASPFDRPVRSRASLNEVLAVRGEWVT